LPRLPPGTLTRSRTADRSIAKLGAANLNFQSRAWAMAERSASVASRTPIVGEQSDSAVPEAHIAHFAYGTGPRLYI